MTRNVLKSYLPFIQTLRRPETRLSVRFFHNSLSWQRQKQKKSPPRKKNTPFRTHPSPPYLAEQGPIFRQSRAALSTSPQTRVYQRLKDYIKIWSNESTTKRLEAFGIPSIELQQLLSTFSDCIRKSSLPSVDEYDEETITQVLNGLNDLTKGIAIDRTITQIFLDWVCLPQFQSIYTASVSQSTLSHLQKLRAVTEFPYPAELYPAARAMNRKIIMHVGPTNSGKTHHALRALAAANSGVYAGPLRLLAQEIWDRLNKGQIVPLGVEPDQDAEADETGTDILDGNPNAAPIITKQTNPKFARLCNLLTGEEFRMVSEFALLSCTVEMLPMRRVFDVAVIDEIQMIADPDRGSGWTTAVLGLCAKEIHLCGEETAIPIIERLVAQTGDELIVNRYQRLTPLHVSETSLDGDYSNITKGDCVIAFSRTDIYRIKDTIEHLTGLRCTVAYGRLPPEIRSEQAALFNDPSSDYDVMVGSDAIGMGLNLKIKRIVFSTVRKWDGTEKRLLSTSQIKQIAGRAGRYGLHGDSPAPGLATTLDQEDIPILKTAMETPFLPLQHAALPHNPEYLTKLYRVLPETTLNNLVDQFHHLCKVPPPYMLSVDSNFKTALETLAPYAKYMGFDELLFWYMAPVPWRDLSMTEIIDYFLKSYTNDFSVSFMKMLDDRRLSEVLDQVLEVREKHEGLQYKDGPPLRMAKKKMMTLETIHRSIVLYLWFGMRNPTVFFETKQVLEVKQRAETAMEFVLEALTLERENRPDAGVLYSRMRSNNA